MRSRTDVRASESACGSTAARRRRAGVTESLQPSPTLQTVFTTLLFLGAAAAVASAQTIIVTNAPPGAAVEFVLNEAAVANGTTDQAGSVTLTATPPPGAARGDMDAQIYVDACDTLRRVLIVDRSVPVRAAAPGCVRSQIAGLFLVRPISTLVLDVTGPTPTVLLRQGRFTPPPPGEVRTWSPSPTGLVVSGAAGFAALRDPAASGCGDVTDCSGDGSGLAYAAGAAFWFTRLIAAEVVYMRPSEGTATGQGSNFRFDGSVDAHVLTLAAKVGIPIGPVRLYGKGGATRTWATLFTTQTSEDVTQTVNGVTTTVPGGTTEFGLKTEGWGWIIGGGLEGWMTRSVAIYVEGGRAALKGESVEDAGAEGSFDDALTYIGVGLKVRVGR